MAAEDTTASGRQRRVDVRIKVNLKYPDRETFVARFSQNLSRTGIFIRASDPAPVGSRIHFEYRLHDETRILRGSGIVRWARRPDDSTPDNPPGMGLEFIDLDPQSDQLIHEIVARHGEGSRAPQRKKATPAPVAAPESAAPALTLEDASLDPEEEDALDALLGGTPAPTPAETASAPEAEIPAGLEAAEGDDEIAIDDVEVELADEVEIEAEAPEVDIQVEPEATEAEIEIEPDVEAEIEAEAELEPELEAELEAKLEAEVEVELDRGLETEIEIEPEVEVELEAEVEIEPETEVEVEEAEVEIESEAEEQLEAEVEIESEVDLDLEVEIEPGVETVEAMEADANIEGASEVESQPTVAMEPVVDEEAPARRDSGLPAGPDESILAEFDDIDEEDEAPRRPPSGDVPIHNLTAADEETLADFDDGFDADAAAETDWVLDVSGAALVSAPIRTPGEPEEMRLAAVDGRIIASTDGIPIRNLIGWAGRPWPSAYALAAARRNGITLSDTEEQVVMTLGDVTAPIWDAVDALIDHGTAAFSDPPPATVHVIVPSSTSEAVRDMLHDRLGALGVTSVRLIPDALAILEGVGVHLDPGHWGLVANIAASEARVVLIRGPDEVITTHVAPDLGLLETDRALTERCVTQFLREHELDVEDDPSLRADLRGQVASLRRSGAAPWDITIAGAPIQVSTETLDQWTRAWRERIAITAEALLSTHGGELAAPSAVVLASEEPVWRGLADTLTELLGAETLVAEPGHAGRRRGLG